MTGRSATAVRFAWPVLVAAFAAGCGGGGERAEPETAPPTPGAASSIPVPSAAPPSPPANPRLPAGLPDPRRIDQKNATAVSRAALTVMYTVDSTVDAGLRDAKLRAARYLTRDYRAEVAAEPRQYIPAEWRRHRAYLAVRLEPLPREAGAPSDTATTAYRQWQMTTIPTGRDDWRGTARPSVAFMTLARSSERDPWRIRDVLVTGTNQ